MTDIEKGNCSHEQSVHSNDTTSTGWDPAKEQASLATLVSAQPIPPESTCDDSCKDNSDADSIKSIGNQTNILPTRQLFIAFPALATALFVSVIDQTSVSTSIPAISAELNTGSATSWIGGSFVLASSSFQLINGRISDIFGRKKCLLIYLALLAIGDLICGFAVNKEMLFAARALAGVGGGGLVSCVLITISDVVTLENRGKFQGILGAIISMANGSGPFIGGILVEKASWRWTFHIVPMLAVPSGLIIYFFLPLKHTPGNLKEKAKKVDYWGILLNLAAVLLILVPLSGAGVSYAWKSPMVISMLTIGGVLSVIFVLYEWKIARIPILPLRLFTGKYCAPLYVQTFCAGLCFFCNFFYLPMFYQSVLGYSAVKSGSLVLPLICLTSFCSICAGQFMGRVHRYKPVLVTGCLLWTIGAGLKTAFNRHTKLWEIVVTLMLEGMGIGFTLQPTLVALLANSRSEDRAVCTGLRNFIRTIGGTFGLIISGAILSNTLTSSLSSQPFATPEILKNLVSSTYKLESLGLSAQDRELVLDAYMSGLRYIFIMVVAFAGLNLLCSLGSGNTSLKKPKPAEKTGRSRMADGTGEDCGDSDEEKDDKSGAELETVQVVVGSEGKGQLAVKR